MLQRPHVQKLIERVRPALPLRAAFVFPCDVDALQLALSGAFAGYLAPRLVGPAERMREAAAAAGLNLSGAAIVDTGPDATAAIARALQLARDGEVDGLIRGSVTSEALLAAVAMPESGLRTATRLSHATVLDLPGLDRPLVLADAQLNVSPTLAAKRDILLNTLALARAMGIATPRVGLLAAVDRPSQSFVSTTDAVALRSMSLQGLFGAAVFEGPLTPGRALARAVPAREAARSAARAAEFPADVLLAPGMEAAVMLARSLPALTGGLATGLVLGARVPIVLPAHDDTLESRMAACVLAALMARAGGAAADAASDARAGGAATVPPAGAVPAAAAPARPALPGSDTPALAA